MMVSCSSHESVSRPHSGSALLQYGSFVIKLLFFSVIFIQPGASAAVLIGGAQPPIINASDLKTMPFDPEKAFTYIGSFSSSSRFVTIP